MGSQLLIWVVVSLGFFFCFFSLPVVCDEDGVNRGTPPPPQELQSSSSPSPSPPPSPPPPTPPLLLPPPPDQRLPPHSRRLPPLPDQRLPPHSRRLPPPPKPPAPSPWAPPPPSPPEDKNAFHNPPSYPLPSTEDVTRKSSDRKPNLGRKVGLTFVGIAAMLQVCVVAFLLIKRRQMLTTTNGSF